MAGRRTCTHVVENPVDINTACQRPVVHVAPSLSTDLSALIFITQLKDVTSIDSLLRPLT